MRIWFRPAILCAVTSDPPQLCKQTTRNANYYDYNFTAYKGTRESFVFSVCINFLKPTESRFNPQSAKKNGAFVNLVTCWDHTRRLTIDAFDMSILFFLQSNYRWEASLSLPLESILTIFWRDFFDLQMNLMVYGQVKDKPFFFLEDIQAVHYVILQSRAQNQQICKSIFNSTMLLKGTLALTIVLGNEFKQLWAFDRHHIAHLRCLPACQVVPHPGAAHTHICRG